MHTPKNLKKRARNVVNRESVEMIPLFHVVTFDRENEPNVQGKERRLLRQSEIILHLLEILKERKLDNTCGALCKEINGKKGIDDERGLYWFFGHLYPISEVYRDEQGQEITLNLVDNTCFVMIQAASLAEIPLKGTPFDSGGVYGVKSKIGEHVQNNGEYVQNNNEEYSNGGNYICEHSADGMEAVLEYFSSYVELYFDSESQYVDRMFQVNSKAITIDNLELAGDADSRNIAFEVRCFKSFAIPKGSTLVIAEEIDKIGKFPRDGWGEFNFEIVVDSSPIIYAKKAMNARFETQTCEKTEIL